MAPSTSSNTPQAANSSSNESIHGSEHINIDLHDILAQINSHMADGGSDAANNGSDLDSLSGGIVDSLTLVNCSRLLTDIIEDQENPQEADCDAFTRSAPHRGHRRSGVRRSSTENNSGILWECTVQTKTK
jgi:hypothetical protein